MTMGQVTLGIVVCVYAAEVCIYRREVVLLEEVTGDWWQTVVNPGGSYKKNTNKGWGLKLGECMCHCTCKWKRVLREGVG